MTIQIGCIVEGHGEVEAVPLLVRRIANAYAPQLTVHVPRAIRVSRSKFIKAGELERTVELAARQVRGQGAILILIDSDDDCPAQLGPELQKRAVAARSDLPIGAVLAKREFESWFLAAAESLRGKRELPMTLQPPPHPEAIHGAKEWLSQQMPSGKNYVPTEDQAALTAQFDLTRARQCDSFDKCYREIVRLLTELREAGQM
jgi:hypothetical protein